MKRVAPFAEEIAAVMVMLALFATSGCTSDKTYLANNAAAYTFHEDRYEARCVAVKGPTDCPDFQADLKTAKTQLATADKVIHIGKIPSEEKAEINATMKKIRKHK